MLSPHKSFLTSILHHFSTFCNENIHNNTNDTLQKEPRNFYEVLSANYILLGKELYLCFSRSQSEHQDSNLRLGLTAHAPSRSGRCSGERLRLMRSALTLTLFSDSVFHFQPSFSLLLWKIINNSRLPAKQ